MLGVNPILLLILAVIFFGILYLTKYVSLSSIIAAISCVIGSLIIHDYILFGMSAFVSIILIFRHRSNIVRIFKGEEPKSNGCKMDDLAPNVKIQFSSINLNMINSSCLIVRTICFNSNNFCIINIIIINIKDGSYNENQID